MTKLSFLVVWLSLTTIHMVTALDSGHRQLPAPYSGTHRQTPQPQKNETAAQTSIDMEDRSALLDEGNVMNNELVAGLVFSAVPVVSLLVVSALCLYSKKQQSNAQTVPVKDDLAVADEEEGTQTSEA